jgi:hypothetical protein
VREFHAHTRWAIANCACRTYDLYVVCDPYLR